MDSKSVTIVQLKLRELGHYNGKIDGDRGPKTHAAVVKGIPDLQITPPTDWRGFSDKRKTIVFLQMYCLSEGIDAGPLDGWWGPQTDFAADALAQKLDGGQVINWRDIAPIDTNPHGFPKDNTAALTAFYGPPGKKDGSFRPPMVKVPCPWTLKIAWNMNQTRSFLWAHEKCADSVATILEKVHAHYGEAAIEDLRLNIFSGDYAPRLKKGGTTPSTHSWAIAYDFDDTNNQLKWNSAQATFARSEYNDWWEIWESEGWLSLGRTRNFDWMHVQAAKL